MYNDYAKLKHSIAFTSVKQSLEQSATTINVLSGGGGATGGGSDGGGGATGGGATLV